MLADLTFPNRPSSNGVFGREIVLNIRSGRACLRAEDGSVIGAPPEPPLTNAFFVWVGRAVVVVSSGVGAEDMDHVAGGLRRFIGDEQLPIVFHTGQSAGSDACTTASPGLASARELALAEAYVLVQCAWLEVERIRVEVDGRGFDFRVDFLPLQGGGCAPFIE